MFLNQKKLTKKEKLSNEAFSLIYQLLNKDPNTRLGVSIRDISTIQQSSFFQGIDWSQIKARKVKAKLDLVLDQSASNHVESDFENDFHCNNESQLMSCFNIENDCSQTSLWIENFTQDLPTHHNSIKN